MYWNFLFYFCAAALKPSALYKALGNKRLLKSMTCKQLHPDEEKYSVFSIYYYLLFMYYFFPCLSPLSLTSNAIVLHFPENEDFPNGNRWIFMDQK